jgi:hypothetical protein
MSDTLLGKRHDYASEEAKSLSDRAKELGFSSVEIGELARLYGLSEDELEISKPVKKTGS